MHVDPIVVALAIAVLWAALLIVTRERRGRLASKEGKD